MTDWAAGMEAVCVAAIGGPIHIAEGTVHTVTGTRLLPAGWAAFSAIDDTVFIADHDHVFLFLAGKGNLLFDAERFRPVQKRKTSIEIFTRMLKRKKQDA